jgi:molybdopterin synthase sulfur carrier subunit
LRIDRVKLRYFAWVRERIGKDEEDVAIPADVTTIAELLDWLAGRGARYAFAFENRKIIGAAIDHNRVRPDAPIANAGEIAFFPPMTGG